MRAVEIHFGPGPREVSEVVLGHVGGLIGAWRYNGQLVGRDQTVVSRPGGVSVFGVAPERGALAPRRSSVHVRRLLGELRAVGLARPRTTDLGFALESAAVDRCRRPSSYVMFTTYVALATPLRCGDCFGAVPLYRLDSGERGDHGELIAWESDYQACDSLQMNCATGERFGSRELSRVDSSLTRRGRQLGHELTTRTGVPVYYYLYRYGGRSLAREQARRCPGCGGRWLLREVWHDQFDFRCDRCRLVSNVAWNVRP